MKELLEWELWRTFCDLYHLHWGVWPSPEVQKKFATTHRQTLKEARPPKGKKWQPDEWRERLRF